MRRDYSDAAFDPLAPKIRDRAKFLRSLDPELTEAEATSRARRDFQREQNRLKKQTEQNAAQQKLESSLGLENKE